MTKVIVEISLHHDAIDHIFTTDAVGGYKKLLREFKHNTEYFCSRILKLHKAMKYLKTQSTTKNSKDLVRCRESISWLDKKSLIN
jgi:hypothetical protein